MLESSVRASLSVPMYLFLAMSPLQVVIETWTDLRRPTNRSLWLDMMQVAELLMMKLTPLLSKENALFVTVLVAKAVCVKCLQHKHGSGGVSTWVAEGCDS